MIHYKREGQCIEVGLNITVGRNGWLPWITFIWAWYNIKNTRLMTWRLRIRTWQFAIFTSASSENVIISHLKTHDQHIVNREFLEDLLICTSMIELNHLLMRNNVYGRLRDIKRG